MTGRKTAKKHVSRNPQLIQAERRAKDAKRARERRAAAKQKQEPPTTVVPEGNPVTIRLSGKMKPGTLDRLLKTIQHAGPAALFPETPATADAAGTSDALPPVKYVNKAGLWNLFCTVNSLPREALPPRIQEALEVAREMSTTEPPIEFTPAKSHESLFKVLQEAYEQAAGGKGQERHANGLPYEQQPMQVISGLLHSSEGLSWQVIKKTQEAHGMLSRARASGNPDEIQKAKAFHRKELLGAINYLAGAVIFEEGR